MSENKGAESARSRSIKCGYEKIAFGGVNDAVRLLFTEAPDLAEFKNMDFFNIAEIKRVKGGGMEIKFYDRMKALECLKELGEKGGKQSPLYRALEKCAKSFEEEKEDGI